ncbi:MAG: AAA family ATPase, partial [Bacteroidales bacterium]|nr:AAA family ATPase [Bacteroidales bacterium]
SQGGVSFDVREESEGTKRYYELSGVLMLLVKENHFVTIDELECRLHPDLYEHFVLTYLKNTKESQIIFTTHSREFLNDRGLFRDDSVWITEKTDVGATNLYSLADFDSNFLRNTTNRYNMYKAGRLGGVPRLQDTYFGSND